jgi:FkbM family methyltransferase
MEPRADVGRRVKCVINGDPLWLCPEFAHAEPVRAEWEPELYRRFKEALRPGMVVVDVGASFGLYSVAAARAVGRSGRVYAFEPARATASALRRHLRWNGVADRVEVIEAAAAEDEAGRTFWEQETSFVASLDESVARQEERRYASPPRPRRVPTATLDDFVRSRAVEPDAIKVDVEGGEARVLRGARAILERRRTLLFLEVHSGFPVEGDDPEAVLVELRAAGWECEQVGAEAATRHYVCAPPASR